MVPRSRLPFAGRHLCPAVMSSRKMPARWEKYTPVGRIVTGTRFVPFKVPLQQTLNWSLPPEVQKFSPDDLLSLIQEQNRDLGIVVDLTNITKYYKMEDILNQGISYEKIWTEGHVVPSGTVQKLFFKIVDDFLASNDANERVIGVHCTHGVNRTGYLICRYMIDRMNFKADDAIRAFNEARGHAMECQRFLSDLRGEPVPTVAFGQL